MSNLGKIFKGLKDKRNLTTRPGAVGLGSKDVTGIAPGDAGTNRTLTPTNRRPGRRAADTPLGPGRNRM